MTEKHTQLEFDFEGVNEALGKEFLDADTELLATFFPLGAEESFVKEVAGGAPKYCSTLKNLRELTKAARHFGAMQVFEILKAKAELKGEKHTLIAQGLVIEAKKELLG